MCCAWAWNKVGHEKNKVAGTQSCAAANSRFLYHVYVYSVVVFLYLSDALNSSPKSDFVQIMSAFGPNSIDGGCQICSH